MPEVTVRDARPDDAAAIARVWAATLPLLVRSAARVPADMAEDATLGRRRWVGLLDDAVVATASARRTGEREVYLTVEVHPDSGSRGVGTALLRRAVGAFSDATDLVAVCTDDPISLAFAVRNGFLPDGEHRVSTVVPATVPAAGPAPSGYTAVTLDRLPDLDGLLATHNAAAVDDPSGLSRVYTRDTFLADWWNSPDNAPELSYALLDISGVTPVVASFTSTQVDRPRRRAWSAMTATHPDHRGRGLARWVKQRSLNAVAAAGVALASTANDDTNAPMVAVNTALGYQPAARSIRVQRRLLH
ncbi:GNAT family N-acetyltransferase [Nocardioides panacis]|uniref:GNAT family N-acetyltransferase n=1 Tax=Nocardioides panacis TaxID=2849501 RepID=A0A975SUZ4_9ACTN|nr:GNAT family N-acetyltransferase [Nocardioides panacis]QWZ06344.1 GNAT family N-acetyltransferase [Nocardioides panacis]